jgi:hypothetical protein
MHNCDDITSNDLLHNIINVHVKLFLWCFDLEEMNIKTHG